MGFIDQGLRAIDPRAGQRAVEEANQQNLGMQQQAFDYLKESEALPIEVRNQALEALQSYFTGGGQQQFIDQAMQSPLYQSLLGQGEDAILRNASATGGLRSGNAQQALAQNSQGVLNSVIGQQLQGLQGLAGTPTQVGSIYNAQSGLGQQMGQNIISNEQARQGSVASTLALGGQLASLFSDIRLKENIEAIGIAPNGSFLYSWDWNDKAKEVGLTGSAKGVMAHEQDLDVLSVDDKTGYLLVDYNKVLN